MFWNKQKRSGEITIEAAKITINGKTYQGRNIKIRNGVVEVDGAIVQTSTSGPAELEVEEGRISLEVTGDLNVKGDIHGNVQVGGDLKAGNISGTVKADGDIQCGDVSGPVQAGGDVKAGSVSGGIRAGGDVMTGR